MRKFTSHSPICHASNTHCVAGDNMEKIRIFRALSPAMQEVFVLSKIRQREVVLRVREQFFYIHHFGVAWISVHLIAAEVWNHLVGYGMECQGTSANHCGSNHSQHYSGVSELSSMTSSPTSALLLSDLCHLIHHALTYLSSTFALAIESNLT